MIIDCTRYVAGVRVTEPMSLGDAGRLARETEGFVWVALSDPAASELHELRAALGVQRLALDASAEGPQRPKLEHHGENTTLTVKTVRPDGSTTPLDRKAAPHATPVQVALQLDFKRVWEMFRKKMVE